MPGTRTAPAVDGSPVYLTISLTFYDWTGDQRTDSYQVDADSTDIEIEAFCAAVVALSNGTLWRITVGQVYNGVGDKNDALEEVWENVNDNAVFLMKKVDNSAEDFFIPSPVNAMFLENSEQIDPAYAATATFLAATLPMRLDYSWISARMSHRKQIGKKINL